MEVFKYVRHLLLPEKKNDIQLRCAIAMRSSGDNEDQHKLLLKESEADEDTCHNDLSYPNNKDHGADHTIKRFSWTCFPAKRWFGRQEEQVRKVAELEDYEYYVPSPLDTFIGYAVEVAGTIHVLFIVVALFIAWIVWGCLTKGEDTWQIVMQDGQSIQTYVWNTFLMRQQLDNDERLLLLYGKLKSRYLTHRRLIQKLVESRGSPDTTSLWKARPKVEENVDEKKIIDFVSKSLFDRVSHYVEKVLGSLPAVTIYWIGIFVWIGCGALPLNEGTSESPDMQIYSNTWQMYVNTATAIELLITTVFLGNVRNRTNAFILKQTEIFDQIDGELERLLREIDGNDTKNELVVVHRYPRDRVQQLISFYAHVVGNGLGLIISVCVFSTWIGIGNLMHWNANWWLVIGTYTGLIGFIDGFVLREIFYSITHYEQGNFLELLDGSQELLDSIGIPVKLERPKIRETLSNRISLLINQMCSSKWSVVLSFVVVIGLIILASAMRWSETAQLIANTPTMIVEGSFLLILIQAHNWACDERKLTLLELNRSRVLLVDYVSRYQAV